MDCRIFCDLEKEGMYENLWYLADGQVYTEDDWSFDIHRIILAKENSYFRKLFNSLGKEKTVALIPGINGKSLDKILYYIYTGSISLNNENAYELLEASDYLLVNELKLEIKQYLKDNMSLDSCVPSYLVSLKMDDEDLRKCSYRYMQVNFEKLINNNAAGVSQMPLSIFENLLKDENLFVVKEEIIWKAIVKWVLYDSPNRHSKVPDLLKCLKVGDIEESLASEIIHHDILFKNPLFENMKCIEFQKQFQNDLDVLKDIIKSYANFQSTSLIDFQCHRYPRCLYIIVYKSGLETYSPYVQLNITYDEHIDVWRELGESKYMYYPFYSAYIGYKVYFFDEVCDNYKIFNLNKNKWNVKNANRMRRAHFCLVTLKQNIYFIGGLSDMQEPIMDVEYLNTELGTWMHAAYIMKPVITPQALVFKNKIYVVGKGFDESNNACIIAQVYDPETNLWSSFTAPSTCHGNYIFIEYHGKFYIISECSGSDTLKIVEVFDFDTNSWRIVSDFHFAAYGMDAIVLNDELIVYANCGSHAVIKWNEIEKRVDIIEHLSVTGAFGRYWFYTIDDSKKVNKFVKRNKYNLNKFKKSHFGTFLLKAPHWRV